MPRSDKSFSSMVPLPLPPILPWWLRILLGGK